MLLTSSPELGIMRVLVCAPVAQLDRVPGYELGGREFESLRAHHYNVSNEPEHVLSCDG